MKKPKVAIIVPTIRESSIEQFFKSWKRELALASKEYTISLYLVEDNPEPTFKIKFPKVIKNAHHLSWKEIDGALGKDSWIIPRRTDAVRSYGILFAYQEDNEYFITLDDDCYPAYDEVNKPGYFISQHIQNLTKYSVQQLGWVNTIEKYKTRGLPYGDTTTVTKVDNVAVSHGLWVNVPDFDSITALSTEKKDQYFDHLKNQLIPKDVFFPMCSMNLAWTREITPLMYFLLMGSDENEKKFGFDRFGDIWCGLFVKKIIDKLGYFAVSGDPYIYHDRASNSYVNLQKEAPGIKLNEVLWKDLNSIQLTSKNIKGLYKELASKLPTYSPYWEKLAKAMHIWIDLY